MAYNAVEIWSIIQAGIMFDINRFIQIKNKKAGIVVTALAFLMCYVI